MYNITMFSRLLLILLVVACSSALANDTKEPQGKFELVSSAFRNNEEIALKYTCYGGDVNPPLEFKNIPPKTKSLALTIQDLDAAEGVWVHWVVYNIPPTTNKIPPNVIPGYEALNDFGKYNYAGPCPVDSKAHRYVLKAYAVKAILAVDEGMTIKDLEKAIGNRVIAKSELIGTYQKSVW